MALEGLSRRDEAVQAFRQQVNAAPDALESQAMLAWGLGLVGQRQEALTILGNLEHRRGEGYVSGVLLAQVCLGLGDHDQAVSWLQHAVEERDGMMPTTSVWPAFDSLRSDPRFHALLKKMNFPASADQPSSSA